MPVMESTDLRLRRLPLRGRITHAGRVGWLGALLLMATTPAAEAEELPAEKQAAILTRALAYDDNLNARAGDTVVVAVLVKEGQGPSEAAAEAMLRGFRSVERLKVRGLPFKALRLAYTSVADLGLAVDSKGIDAVYVTPAVDRDLGAISEFARKRHIITMGSRAEHIESGLALGVFAEGGKNTIVVNLAAARAEGCALASDLLRLARVIK